MTNSNGFPAASNYLPTLEDENYLSRVGNIVDQNIMVNSPVVHSVFTKPLVLSTGMVLKGTNNKYYMLTTDGTTIMKEVKNLFRLENPVNGRTAKELYRTTGSSVDKYYCVDLGYDYYNLVTWKDGTWKQYAGTADELVINGTGSQIASLTPTRNYITIFNLEINHAYTWYGTYWGWVQTGTEINTHHIVRLEHYHKDREVLLKVLFIMQLMKTSITSGLVVHTWYLLDYRYKGIVGHNCATSERKREQHKRFLVQ